MRSLLLVFTMVLPALGGAFNVVHLAGDKELTIEVSCDKKTQSFTLEAGSDSGSFTLPEKPAAFRITDSEHKAFSAPASKDGRVLLLYHKDNKPEWHVVPSQETKETSSLRMINLCDGAVALTMAEKQYELKPSQFLDVGAIEKNQVSAQLDGQKKVSTSAEEPTAFLAVIYPTAEGPQIRFIADR